MCPKCGLVQMCPADDSYKYGLCWICFLKSREYYKSAIREVKLGWFVWSTHISDIKTGWSFVEKIQWSKIFLAILKCGSLNKTPKVPIDAKPQDYDWSDWQVQAANEYYPKPIVAD